MRKVLGLVLSVFVFSFYLCNLCSAATPSKIKYQGVLKEKGTLVTGAKTMKFRITNSDGATAYWDSENVSVLATQGAFSYELAVSSTIDWKAGGYYLEVTIGGQLLSPREEIGSTVYALQARDIDDGIVVAAKIADSAVTTSKIADSAVTAGKLNQASVSTVFLTTSAAINNSNSVNSPANVISWNQIKDMPLVFADGTDDGAGASLDSVGSYHIIDSTITSADIKDGAITSSKILDGTIATADIADSQITSAKILDGTMVNADVNAFAAIAATKLSGVLTVGGNRTDTNLDALTGNEVTALHSHAGGGGGGDNLGTHIATMTLNMNTFPLINVATMTGTGNLLFSGGTGGIPATGLGTRLMWYPAKRAFRAGYVSGTQWDDVNIGEDSTAMGSSTIASGEQSTAMGYTTIASGPISTAMGYQTTAGGENSTAMGFATTASGDQSTAMGEATTAIGVGSTAMGVGTTASGGSSTAMGEFTTASGSYSTAIGQWVTAGSAANTITIGKGVDNTTGRLVNNTANSFMVGFAATPTLTVDKSTVTVNGGLVTYGSIISTGTDGGGGIPTGLTGPGARLLWYPAKNAFRAGYVDGTQWDDGNIGNSSIAMGYNTTASGQYSTAMGQSTTASLTGDTAMGSSTIASGGNSTAMGFNTTASGLYSTAMGYQTIAGGDSSTAIGKWVTAGSAANTISIGKGLDNTTGRLVNNTANSFMVGFDRTVPTLTVDKSTVTVNGGLVTYGSIISTGTDGGGGIPAGLTGPGARLLWYPAKSAFRAGYVQDTQWDDASIGDYSTAMGVNTTASGNYSTAMGNSSTAGPGNSSTAMGLSAIASGYASTAIGASIIASGSYSTAMGKNVNNAIANSFMVGFTATPTFTVFSSSVIINGAAGGTGDVLVISTGTDANNRVARIDNTGKGFFNNAVQTGGADYAEWFEKEENGIKPGDIVGLNVKTKKARKYISGDVLIGICSSKPGFVGNQNIDKTDEAMKLDYVLVGLVGQLDFNKEQINIIDEIKVETKDGKQLGYLLSTGKVFLKI